MGMFCLKKRFVAFRDNDADTPFAVQVQVAPKFSFLFVLASIYTVNHTHVTEFS